MILQAREAWSRPIYGTIYAVSLNCCAGFPSTQGIPPKFPLSLNHGLHPPEKSTSAKSSLRPPLPAQSRVWYGGVGMLGLSQVLTKRSTTFLAPTVAASAQPRDQLNGFKTSPDRGLLEIKGTTLPPASIATLTPQIIYIPDVSQTNLIRGLIMQLVSATKLRQQETTGGTTQTRS